MENFYLNEGVIMEPARTNRFLISTIGTEIPPYLFFKYKLYNDGEDLILEPEMRETLNYFFDSASFYNITDIVISNLDPTGVIVQETTYRILKSNFEKVGDYHDDSISTVKFRFVVQVVKNIQHTAKIDEK